MKTRTYLSGELVDAGRNLHNGSSAIDFNKGKEPPNTFPQSPRLFWIQQTLALAACFLCQLDSNVYGKAPGWGCKGKRALQSVEPSAASIPLKVNPKGFTWYKKLCAFFFLIVFPGIHSMFYRKKIMTSFLRM
jgi:hypothetical protein